MLKALVEFSIRYRGVVIALACVLFVYGMNTAARAKLDVFPEFAPPQVAVQTEAVGLSSEQVEQLVTRPIELAMNGVANLDSIRSQSIQGLSVRRWRRAWRAGLRMACARAVAGMVIRRPSSVARTRRASTWRWFRSSAINPPASRVTPPVTRPALHGGDVSASAE